MQPSYPPQYAPMGYPAQPGYPQAPAPYPAPTAYPQAPQYPAQPGYPQAPQYPAQYPTGYGAPAAAPPMPTAEGSLDSFYGQPSSAGGPSFKFKDANGAPQLGKTYVGVVARPVGDSDVRQATDSNGVPQFYKGGKPKFIMVVPMHVQRSQEFPEGTAGWWVKGQARDELVRAMAEAGAPAGAPEAGAMIQVTLVSTRPIPNMNPAFNYRIVYTRPNPVLNATPPPQTPPVEPVRPEAGAYPPPPAPSGFPQHIDSQGQGHYAPAGYAGTAMPGYPVQYAPQPAQPVYAPPAPPSAPPAPPAAPSGAYGPYSPGPDTNPGQGPMGYPPAVAPQYAVPAMHAVAQGVPGPVAPAAGLGHLAPDQLALMATLTGQPTA